MTVKKAERIDHTGPHEKVYRRNREKILKQSEICYICGRPVDKTLKFPDPYSASVDHIIPIDKGGHPSAMSNLALTHLRCNRLKSNKLLPEKEKAEKINAEKRKTQLMTW